MTVHAGSPSAFPNNGPAMDPYVRSFSISANRSDFSPFLISPANDTTAWIVAVKIRNNAVPLSEILSYTIPFGIVQVTPPFSGVPSAIRYNETNGRTRIWLLENDSLDYYDPVAHTLNVEHAFPSGSPQSMIIDKHGMIWITLYGSNEIVEYDPAAQNLTAYPLPIPESGPVGIGLAPDESVWFSEVNGSRIGHLTVGSGSSYNVTSYAPPSNIHILFPIQVTVGDNGTVWFTDHGSNQFGSFNPTTGEWRVFPIGYCSEPYNPECAVGLPNAISFDQIGRLWFSEHFAGRIAQYDPTSGLLTEYIVPANTTSYTWWMQPGPGNLIWFAAFGLGEIGYVNSTVAVPISLDATTAIDLQQGGTQTVSATILSPQSTVSMNISVNDVDNQLGSTPLISGHPSQETIGPSSTPVSTTFLISAAWNLPLGDRDIALTAYNGYVEVNAFVRIHIVARTYLFQTFAPFLGLGLASSAAAGSTLIYWRRPRKLEADEKDEAAVILD